LRWRDAPREYGPHKTVYNRFVRWSRLGVFNKIFAELARQGWQAAPADDRRDPSQSHRTAASLLKKGLFPDVSGARKALELETACRVRWPRAAADHAAQRKAK